MLALRRIIPLRRPTNTPPTSKWQARTTSGCSDPTHSLAHLEPPELSNCNFVPTPVPARPGFFLRTLPSSCVDFSSPAGKTIFAEALADGTMEGYFKLAGHYHAQSEPAYCGIAVLCMVLNRSSRSLYINAVQTGLSNLQILLFSSYILTLAALQLAREPSKRLGGGTERMSCCVPLDVVKKHGIDFDLFSKLAVRHGAGIIPYRYPERTEDEFRRDIDRITRKSDEFIVASYDRASLSQTGHGHFSPIAGYHKAKDLVLLLDVARFKYPPHWVSVTSLFDALKPIDPSTSLSRGYYEVTQGTSAELLCASLQGHDKEGGESKLNGAM